MIEGSLLLVPTERHVELELSRQETRLGEDHGTAIHDGPVLARWPFLAGCLAKLCPELRVATPHACRLATRVALDALAPGRLRQPSEPAAQVALAFTFDRALGGLRRAGTEPDDLRGVGSPFAGAIADVLEHADALLSDAGLVDPRGIGAVLGRALRDLPRGFPLPSAVTVRGIAAWELDDLTWVEALHAAIRRRNGQGVTVELPQIRGPEGDAMEPIADTLEKRWASLADAPELLWTTASAGASGAAITARTPEGEARAVATEVARALARGVAPERIAIVVPTLDDAAMEPLRAALLDAGVRFHEPRGRAAASCPDGRAALSLLKLAQTPVTREQTIELLRAPGLSTVPWTDRGSPREAARRAQRLAHRLREVPVEVDRTGKLLVEALRKLVEKQQEERTARASRKRGSAGEMALPLSGGDDGLPPVAVAARAPRGGKPGDDEDESWMPFALERLLASGRHLGEGETRPELARRLLALMDQLKLGVPVADELRSMLKAELRGGGRGAGGLPQVEGGALAMEAIGQGARAAKIVRELVEGMAQASRTLGLAERPCTVEELYAELERAATEVGVCPQGAPARAGAVRVDLPGGLAGLWHEVVVVTGLSSRAYSGAAGPEDVLVGEHLRAKLPPQCRPPSMRERQGYQRAELSWVVAGATAVSVSYTRGDESEPSDPHALFRWVSVRKARKHEEPASRVALSASKLGPRGAELIALASGAPPSTDVAERARIERERAAFFLDLRVPAEAHTGQVEVGRDAALGAQLQAAVGGGKAEKPIAVTHIERAMGCRFAAFARRVLRVRRVEDLLESADARERGTMIHGALEAAFEALRELSPESDPDVQLQRAREAAEAALGADAAMAPLRRDAIEKAVSDALQVVVRTIDAGDPVRFSLAEQRFGAREDAPWGALELEDDEGGGESLFVDGVIDRIDRSTDGRIARVIDYKTGRLPDKKQQERALQLPLYAAVVRRALGAEEVRAQYMAVRQRGLVEESPAKPEAQIAFADRAPQAATEARKAVRALWVGDVAPRPTRQDMCASCDARDVCRRPAVMPIEEASEERG
ncbi:PD-(D/E)XK nuclease family protein [Chondromyces crocatus]|uniref:PD-(D/E)XK nuclease family protein n=1 Tax=Chondromyces crocatus TaxID=52 RepID=UPI0012E2004B|nr:PD-(D/E)XK nuclease family protein [Chondromyces crocatus]